MGKENTYANSPLGTFAAGLIKGIADLKKKYPEQNTLEQKHAHRQFKALEIFADRLHKNLLPQFDNHHIPNLIDMVSMIKDVYTLYSLKGEFNTRQYTLYLNIKAILPTLLKQAQNTHKDSQSVAKALVKALEAKKEELFKTAALIPGEPLQSIFEKITLCIEQAPELEIDFKQTDCLPNLEILLEQMLFKKNKEEGTKKTLNEAELLLESLFEFEEGKANIVVAEPMIFEFSELLVRLKENSPPEMSRLLPFFNPKAFHLDLHSFPAGPAINAFLGATYRLKNIPDPRTGEPSLVYEYTKYTRENPKGITVVIDGNERYPLLSDQYKKSLFTQIQKYFIDYKDTPHVQSLRARISLLDGFKTKESASITTPIKDFLEISQHNLDTTGLNTLEALKATSQEITNNQKLLKQNQALKKVLEEKSASYSKSTVQDLLKTYPELMLLLAEYHEKGINLAFCAQPLPDLILGPINDDTNEAGIIEHEKYLKRLIIKQLKLLQKNHAKLEEKLNRHVEQQHVLTKAWQQETIATHQKNVRKTLSALTDFNQSLTQIKSDNQKLQITADDVDALEVLITNKKQLLLKYDQLHGAVNTELEDFEKLSKLSSDLELFDPDHQVQQTLTQESRPVIEKIRLLLKDVQTAHQEQVQEIHALESNLEKAKSEAEFAKNMLLVDPQKMKQLQLDFAKKIETVQIRQEQLIVELKNTTSTIEAHEEEAIRINESIAQKNSTSEEIKGKITNDISSIYARAETSNLVEKFPEQETLMESFVHANQFIIQVVEGITQMELEARIAPTEFQTISPLLMDIRESLQKAKKDFEIPFESIDRLPKLVQMSRNFNLKGFNFFLSLVGLEQEIDSFAEYREQQNDVLNKIGNKLGILFKTKPLTEISAQRDAYNKKLELLTNAIDAKLRFLNDKHQEQEHRLETEQEFKKLLGEVSNDLEDNFSKIEQIKTELTEIEAQRLINSSAIIKLKEEQKQKNDEAQLLAKEQESLESDQKFTNQIIHIIEEIQSYQQRVKLFSENTLSLHDALLYTEICTLQKEFLIPKGSIEQFVLDINQAGKETNYAGNINVLNKLLETTQHTFGTVIKAKLDTTPLMNLNAQYSSELADLESTHSQEDSLSQSKVTLAQYNRIGKSISQQQKVISKLKQHASIIADEQFNQSIIAVRLSQESLVEQSKQLGESLLDDAISALQQLKVNARIFKDKELQESQGQHQEYAAMLHSLQETFSKIPAEYEFDRANPTFKNNSSALLKIKTDVV